MKTIKDIRIFKGTIDNINGNSLPDYFLGRELNAAIHRVVLKLRESDFTLGDFHHLYINFTTCDTEKKIMPAKRSVDRYHPWYRFYDYHLDECDIDKIASDLTGETLFCRVKEVLMTFFRDSEEKEQIIENAFAEARKGEKMLFKFKEKANSKISAVIYLRIFDDANFHPLMVIKEKNGKEHTVELEPLVDLGVIGELSISGKKITIKPRKSSYYRNIEPYVYEINDN